jgi:hypothetical protein
VVSIISDAKRMCSAFLNHQNIKKQYIRDVNALEGDGVIGVAFSAFLM